MGKKNLKSSKAIEERLGFSKKHRSKAISKTTTEKRRKEGRQKVRARL